VDESVLYRDELDRYGVCPRKALSCRAAEPPYVAVLLGYDTAARSPYRCKERLFGERFQAVTVDYFDIYTLLVQYVGGFEGLMAHYPACAYGN